MTLEELLNKLIEKGWKPFGEWCHRSPYKRVGIHKNYNKERTYVLFYSNNHSHWKVLRQVVSKESWLWQFVCDNRMLNKKRWSNRVRLETSSSWDYIEIWTWEDYGWKFDSDYEYRLIESALKDENELEDFLLNSIKID